MNEAFDLLLGVYRSPTRAALLPGRALPAQLHDVLRLAGGDAEAVAAGREATGLDEAELAEAAALLLQQLLFFDGADHYRVLGVEADAEAEDLKRHYRALMRWLHPDRDPDNLNSVFAERVNRAWSTLRTPQRRADYDRQRPPPEIPDGATAIAHWQPLDRPWLSGRTVRRLPQLVAAAGALTVVALLALLLWLDRAPHAQPPARRAEVEPSRPVVAVASADAEPERVLTAAYAAPGLPAAASEPAPTIAPADPTTAVATTAVVTPGAPPPRRRAAVSPPVPVSTPPADRRPTPTGTTTPATAAALSDAEIGAFVTRFEQLYAGADVEQFLALFDANVAGNGSDGLDQLRVDYRRLFSNHARRELRLQDMQWRVDGARALGHGRYAASVDAREGRRDTQGQILLGLARDAGGLHIVRLNHNGGR